MLDAAELSQAQEEVITGELVQAMQRMVEEPDAPAWMHRLVALDEAPQNRDGRQGKRRKRIDIEVVRTQRGHRPRFAMEAKRLYCSSSVSEYVGDDGLGCFLSGAYAAGQEIAGMLGYVQTRNPAHWAERLEKKLAMQCQEHQSVDDEPWQPHRIVPELTDTYRSRHHRASPATPILILHTMLRFQ